MRFRFPAFAGVFLLAGPAVAEASVISITPTLPLFDTPYTTATALGCVAAIGICITSPSFTLTSPVLNLNTFNINGQDLVTNVNFSATLTDLSNTPTGTLLLSGTVEQEVQGRTFPTQTGTWTTELLALSLSGPLLGHTATITLNPAQTSGGVTTITPSGGAFAIDSFFDVFVEFGLDTPTPLHQLFGPNEFVAAAPTLSETPLPATLPLFASGLGALGLLGWRRKRKNAAALAAA
jgi:hypothetical protein